jgi:hypothetical protein
MTALSRQMFCGNGLELVELIMALEKEHALDLPDDFLAKDSTLVARASSDSQDI